MAEFKLGRIRFIWKGVWTTGTAYVRDDIVQYGGKTFICTFAHTASANLEADLNNIQPKWDQFGDGLTWEGDWQVANYYKVNDIVRNGGFLYICNQGHTSNADILLGLEADQSKWDLFAEGISYAGVWSTNTKYKINDIAKYGASTYICAIAHDSAATVDEGLEVDLINWSLFSQGIDWKGEWTNTTRYKPYDVVTYFGKIFIANQGHTSVATDALGQEADIAKWDTFYSGINYRQDWQETTRYTNNDIVKNGPGLWICVTPHESTALFQSDQANWQVFLPGLEFEDSWSNSTVYQPGDIVTYGGFTYVAKTNHSGATPSTSAANWGLFITGFNLIGDWDNVTNYRVGDVVRLNGYTYLCTQDHLDQTPPSLTYWNKLNEGFNWTGTWVDATSYVLGDMITFADNSYICVDAHTSDNASNRPDLDLTGAYWNIVSGTAEENTLTTDGDLLYYSGAGPARLGIGTTGQVLSVNPLGTAPNWVDFGLVDNVYYVAPNGLDDVNYGKTLDRPWASVNFACSTILNATRNFNSKYLLDQNVDFIAAEVVEWIDYQVANAIAPFTNTFTYDQAKCERDSGIILDAAGYDIVLGTNYNSVTTGLAYQRANSAYLQSNQKSATIAAVAYLKDGASTLAANAGGDSTSSQRLNTYFDEIIDIIANGTVSTDTAANALSFPTPGVLPTTDALPAADRLQANRNFIAAEVVAYVNNNTPPAGYDQAKCLRDAKYIVDALTYDILYGGNSATIVNAEAYYVGAVAQLPAGQQSATVAAYAHISNVISNIVLGITVTPTAGNLESLDLTGANATSTEATTLDALIQIIEDVITAGNTASLPAVVNPVVTWGSAANQNAKSGIDAGKTTLIANTITYIDTNYLSFNYNKATCLRDMKKIVKAVGYDLSHGGNVESRKSAQSYFTPAGASYITGQEEETAAAIIYSLEVVDAVLSNLAPAVNYQTQNSVAVPVSQVIDGAYTEEAGSFATYSALTSLITSAITAGNAAAIPAEQVVNNTLFVKTGEYVEILPIVVPANTAIVGDELRSTRIVAGPGYNLSDDMFRVRNGCGLRNMTFSGMQGSLGTPNAYGTQRPTGGAYVSLDPGEDSTDRLAWISSRSPYIQNCSSFGSGCIGLKVDGGLHDGGNDSIVANDFTQILSDGIGYWVTNLGRSELVSVFTYYCHVGYLSENGGKIRATNGNNSYGAYGSVAEGIDVTEVPNLGTVNNYYSDAIISNTVTDGDRILVLEYANSGVNYTTASFDFVGEGVGAEINTPTIRNNAVFEVRLLNTAGNYGGDGYSTALNNAQNGSPTQLTISATDTANSPDYVGMAVFIESGLGVGQYAYIDTFNAGTKVATVKKMSDDTAGWDHYVPGTAIEVSLDQTSQYRIEPRLIFADPVSGITATGRARVATEKIYSISIIEPGSGYDPFIPPTVTIVDPTNTINAPLEVRVGSGVLGQPTWTDRGTGYETAATYIESGDGYADIKQNGKYLFAAGLTRTPLPGSNLQIAGDDTIYKLVQVFELQGIGPFTARLQVSPEIPVDSEPTHDAQVTMRIRYSQVRLTGHDYLDIGTGNFGDTNYPGLPFNSPNQLNEAVENGGGRVFYTSTDQDGNFRIGELFTVEQATGTATLNADNFSVSGLQELQLGSVSLGGTSATIREFSTDGTFAADSDNIVPTQRAIRTYINAQIGGGSATLNVNTLVAGNISINGNTITTTDGSAIIIGATADFTKGVSGSPLALQYFLNA